MVNDNNVHSLLCGIFQNVECGRPAVNRNQQFRSLSLKVVNRLRTWPVAFIPFGNMNFRHTADRFQKQLQYWRRCCAVNVIIADNCDFLLFNNRFGNPFGCLFHILQHKRIRHQILNLRVNKTGHLVNAHAAQRQYSRHNIRQIVLLNNQFRRAFVRFSRLPQISAQRFYIVCLVVHNSLFFCYLIYKKRETSKPRYASRAQ